MKKKYSREEILIDLSDRKNIKVVSAKKTPITDEELLIFEERINDKYKDLSAFNDFCMSKNMEKNRESFSRQLYQDSLKSMLDQNEFLKLMLSDYQKNEA